MLYSVQIDDQYPLAQSLINLLVAFEQEHKFIKISPVKSRSVKSGEKVKDKATTDVQSFNIALFDQLRAIRGNQKLFTGITDPVEWQREIRKESVLPI